MGTLSDLKGRIATDLTRDDLSDQIANAVSDAIKYYERQRFWFNTTRNLTFNTVANQTAYTAADLAQIPNLVRIDAIYLTQGSSIFALDRYEANEFEILENGSTGPGKPDAFTYVDQAIRLWPKPNAVYAMRIHALYRLATLADGEENAWTDTAEELIRSHAKMLLFMDVLEDDEGAARMQTKIPLLIDAIRAETSMRSTTGTIQGTDF
ncbi:MAG TPA: hypothetical protein DEA80_14485 [Afipia sp.]|nr:hypothetical protein [Afipia sp.]OUX62356.1 MAG: hypothetical protein CBB64_04415 [Afipia sp. TMED4]HBF53304.1 hypothetical protein [Afipia sp.]HBR46108.1 hypothetical protein [Afipia sp.]HCX19035.1 hypothetical protein [Afipia sp.]|tara:strand:+ start:3678 stop:4304 length:627 start_codon:yes stop_codon:yes gene_type:complete